MAEFRKAEDSDAEALAALAERTFRETFAASNTASDMDAHCASNYGTEIQRREIADPRWITILVEEGNELIAFAQVRLGQAIDCVEARNPAELYRIYVDSRWHGRGVAQQLMLEAIGVAQLFRADWIWLGVWERNARAQAFYKKYGFEEVGEHVFTVGSDPQRDLILSRPVALSCAERQ